MGAITAEDSGTSSLLSAALSYGLDLRSILSEPEEDLVTRSLNMPFVLNGVRVFLFGVSHYSAMDAAGLMALTNAIHPDIIAVEAPGRVEHNAEAFAERRRDAKLILGAKSPVKALQLLDRMGRDRLCQRTTEGELLRGCREIGALSDSFGSSLPSVLASQVGAQLELIDAAELRELALENSGDIVNDSHMRHFLRIFHGRSIEELNSISAQDAADLLCGLGFWWQPTSRVAATARALSIRMSPEHRAQIDFDARETAMAEKVSRFAEDAAKDSRILVQVGMQHLPGLADQLISRGWSSQPAPSTLLGKHLLSALPQAPVCLQASLCTGERSTCPQPAAFELAEDEFEDVWL